VRAARCHRALDGSRARLRSPRCAPLLVVDRRSRLDEAHGTLRHRSRGERRAGRTACCPELERAGYARRPTRGRRRCCRRAAIGRSGGRTIARRLQNGGSRAAIATRTDPVGATTRICSSQGSTGGNRTSCRLAVLPQPERQNPAYDLLCRDAGEAQASPAFFLWSTYENRASL
jgi:hypothetical protein